MMAYCNMDQWLESVGEKSIEITHRNDGICWGDFDPRIPGSSRYINFLSFGRFFG